MKEVKNKMNLIIDIGNTRTKIAVINEVTIIKKIVVSGISKSLLEDIKDTFNIQGIILSTVKSAVDKNVIDTINDWGKLFIQLSHETNLPIQNDYKTPKTLGQDRIASVIGATHLFPNEHCLAIDVGTCVTYDFINANQTYIGGSISPGLSMRYRAMHEFTASLPLLNKQRLNTFVGYNTVTSMQTGVDYGLSFEVQGFIQKYFTNFGQIKVIMTGGDAEYLASMVKYKIFVNPDLVLIGLNKILIYNAKFLD
jgi:type III pantothenate kinase